MSERRIPLGGGRQTAGIVRVGDTVRRPRRSGDDTVVAVLRHLEAVGFDGAPRVIAEDDGGELVLGYLPGATMPLSPFRISDACAVSAARLVRRFHDATAGSAVAGDGEVVAHRDLGPHNIVFDGDAAVGIIDWDGEVGPGSRADDLAHAIWCCADLVDPLVPVDEQARKLGLMCAEYGGIAPERIVDELDARFSRAALQHRAAGHADAARIFRHMRRQLLESRDALLAAATW